MAVAADGDVVRPPFEGAAALGQRPEGGGLWAATNDQDTHMDPIGGHWYR